jgi:putative phosphoesterase
MSYREGARATHVRIGLVSDTHMPQRLPALPPALSDVLAGVDLLLHAGDVGELWVLDALSRIAPVIAVHGNDDTEDAQRELPYQQVIVVGGRRILLTHAHYPDRAEELESRKSDAWEPKLARRVAMARSAGATVIVFGHTHIPMAVEYDGVLCINPGAFGPPNLTTRQRIQSVAILHMQRNTPPSVRHIDLAKPDVPFVPQIDFAAGFRAAHDRFGAPLFTPDLAAAMPRLAEIARRIAPEAVRAVYDRLAYRCWGGEQEIITQADVRDEIARDPAFPEDARKQLLTALDIPLPATGDPSHEG